MSDYFLLIATVVFIIVYGAYRFFYQKRFLKTLTEEEFVKGYRKAQLIDVREPNEFKGGHILGARNIPLTQLKHRLVEVRQDKPVYLYCQNGSRSARAANVLKRKGYQDINHLKGGYKKWSGKVKQG